MVKNKKYFEFFLVLYISIQKKKCTSEQFLQGHPILPMVERLRKPPYVKYTCSMETVQQNGRYTLFSSKFPSNIYSILYELCTD